MKETGDDRLAKAHQQEFAQMRQSIIIQMDEMSDAIDCIRDILNRSRPKQKFKNDNSQEEKET